MDEKRLAKLLGAIDNDGVLPSDMTAEEQHYCESGGLIGLSPYSEAYDIEPGRHNDPPPLTRVTAVLMPKGVRKLQDLRS